jgi:hypothetical protein
MNKHRKLWCIVYHPKFMTYLFRIMARKYGVTNSSRFSLGYPRQYWNITLKLFTVTLYDFLEYIYIIKLSHYTPRRRFGDRRYSSYSSSTSALDGGEWSASLPCHALAPGKGSPVHIVQEAGWTPEPVWTQSLEEKPFYLCWGSNLDRPVVQPVARHYNDWANRLTYMHHGVCNSTL